MPEVSEKGSAKGISNKTYVEHEHYTLEGDMELLPDTRTVKIEAGDTVNCLGFGKHLSGLYFVEEITRSIDNSGGYSHGIRVHKNGFGDGPKSGARNNVLGRG